MPELSHSDLVRGRIESYNSYDTLIAALAVGVAELRSLARYLNCGYIHIKQNMWQVTIDDAGMVYDIPDECVTFMKKALITKLVGYG